MTKEIIEFRKKFSDLTSNVYGVDILSIEKNNGRLRIYITGYDVLISFPQLFNKINYLINEYENMEV